MKNIKRELVLITAPLVRVTEKAIAIFNEHTDETVWLPKSQLIFEDETVTEAPATSQAVSVWVPEWLVREKGLA